MSMKRYWRGLKKMIEDVGIEISAQRLYDDVKRVVAGNVVVINDISEKTFRLPSETDSFKQYISEVIKTGNDTLINLSCVGRFLIQHKDEVKILMQVNGY